MGLAEYLVLLFLIIIGLVISDMATSMHRLLNDTESIEWDSRYALMLVCVTLAVFATVALVWANRDFFAHLSYPMFISFMLEMVMVYLLAAASIPDAPAGHFDLGDYYDRKSRYIWGLFALLSLSIILHGFYGARIKHDLPGFWAALPILSVPLVGAVILWAWPRKRLVHWPVLLVINGWFAFQVSGQVLTVGG